MITKKVDATFNQTKLEPDCCQLKTCKKHTQTSQGCNTWNWRISMLTNMKHPTARPPDLLRGGCENTKKIQPLLHSCQQRSSIYLMSDPPPHPKQNKTCLEIACLFVTTEWARLHLKKIYWGNKVLMFLAWDQVRQWSSMYFIALTALSKWSGPSWAKEYCTISCFLCSLALAWGKWHWQAWM